MKKILKRTSIIILFLLVLLLLILSIGSWYFSAPSRLTPLIHNQLDEKLNCKISLDHVELAVLRNFPKVKIELENICLTDKDTQDTILYARTISTEFDIRVWWNTNNIRIDHFILKDGFVHYKIDAKGRDNLEHLVKEKTTAQKTEKNTVEFILKKIKLDNFSAQYSNLDQNEFATLQHLNAEANLLFSFEEQYGLIRLNYDDFSYLKKGEKEMIIQSRNDELVFKINKEKASPLTSIFIKTILPHASFSTKDEVIFNDNHLQLYLPIQFSFKDYSLSFKGNQLQCDDFNLNWAGLIRWDKKGGAFFDLNFKTNTFDVERFYSHLPNVVKKTLVQLKEEKGNIHFDGIVKGKCNEKEIPYIESTIHTPRGIIVLKDLIQ